jgi:hypothetical protein
MQEVRPKVTKHTLYPQLERRWFIDSDAWVIMGEGEGALQRLWLEKQGEAEPQDPHGKLPPFQPGNRASAKPSDSPVEAAHAEFAAALAKHPPRPIPIGADAIDLNERAEHLSTVLGALSAYVAILLDDTAQNVPGGLDLRDAEGFLADLAADLTGTIQRAADSMAGWLA